MLTDEEIRELAARRVSFKVHAVTYVIVNLFFVAVWYFAEGPGGYYWPVWPHLGWGLGLAFHAWGAYGGGEGMVAREEEKLRRKYGRAP